MELSCSKFPKIRELETITELVKLNDYLNVLLGVKPENRMSQVEESVFNGVVVEQFKNWTIQEIKLAFRLAVQGSLEVEMYQKLDAIILGKVMKTYKKYKNNIIKNEMIQQATLRRINREKKIISADEKALIERNFIETALLPLWNKFELEEDWTPTYEHAHMYHVLEGKGLVKLEKEEKKEFIKKAQLLLKRRKKQNRILQTQQRTITTDIMQGDEVSTAKSLALENLFLKLKAQNINLAELLKC